jgi:hypothetical protein
VSGPIPATWALEGLSESPAEEVRDLGNRVTNIEPGPYATGWLEIGSRRSAPVAAYDRFRADTDAFEVGDPAATVPALFAVVDADEPPLRVFSGTSFEPVRAEHMARIAEWGAPAGRGALGVRAGRCSSLTVQTRTAGPAMRDRGNPLFRALTRRARWSAGATGASGACWSVSRGGAPTRAERQPVVEAIDGSHRVMAGTANRIAVVTMSIAMNGVTPRKASSARSPGAAPATT